jgi:hypothetical protein
MIYPDSVEVSQPILPDGWLDLVSWPLEHDVTIRLRQPWPSEFHKGKRVDLTFDIEHQNLEGGRTEVRLQGRVRSRYRNRLTVRGHMVATTLPLRMRI